MFFLLHLPAPYLIGLFPLSLNLLSIFGEHYTQTTISVSDASVVEGNIGTKNLMFRIDLSAPSGQMISVDYSATSDGGGTATEGVDYTPILGSVTFQPGATTQFVYVPIIGDTDTESDETLFLELENATGGATISRATATGTIINDDGLTGGLTLTGTNGNDILTGVGTDDTLIGGLGADQLNGAGGADTFRYNALNESLLAGRDSIVSFNPLEGDRIDLLTLPTAAFFVGRMGGSISEAVVNAAYAAADGNTGLAANEAVFFGTGSGRTARLYLSVNDGIAGFNSATDLVMEVSRMVGAPTVVGSLTPASYFI
ncbi:hypothetical protein IQ218_12960 [Synechocystis salina LEGE 06099]|uniref:bluetail domain-containing putative surface protein n=1 Tax=Synechocystis salina TaxID=945780 RepID=UPI001881C6C8|nr:bluetail domain-containing putative surface protein [Synechocystis salina]MBE9204179.1 hypothetical protein [Synechocystis salina LEGE 06099]